jgi:hypothetical protein
MKECKQGQVCLTSKALRDSHCMCKGKFSILFLKVFGIFVALGICCIIFYVPLFTCHDFILAWPDQTFSLKMNITYCNVYIQC